MNSYSVSPSDTVGRLSESLPRKLSERSPDCDAPTADTDGYIQPADALLRGANKLHGSTDGVANFADPLPHRQRTAATRSLKAKVKMYKESLFSLSVAIFQRTNYTQGKRLVEDNSAFEGRKTSSTEAAG